MDLATSLDTLASTLDRLATALEHVVLLARQLAAAEARAARAEWERDELRRRLADRGDAARVLDAERREEHRAADAAQIAAQVGGRDWWRWARR